MSDKENLAHAIQRAAHIIAEQGASPEVVIVHLHRYQRLIEWKRYIERVGPAVAVLTSKARARLVTRHSGGRHTRKRVRYAR